jgi:hypothetical protein
MLGLIQWVICISSLIFSLFLDGLLNIYTVANNRADEYEKYKTYSAPEPNECILQWWKLNKARFPVLSELARSYLAIPGSATESERLFSASGNMVTKKRSSLKQETVRRAQCLRSWWLNRDLLELMDDAVPKVNPAALKISVAAEIGEFEPDELIDLEGEDILKELGVESQSELDSELEA